MLGAGDPDELDPAAAARAFSQDPQMAHVLGMLEAEITERQGADAWPTYLRSTIARWARWPGYGYADLARITVPVLIMVGDRDHFCSVEEATLAAPAACRRRARRAAGDGTHHHDDQDRVDAGLPPAIYYKLTHGESSDPLVEIVSIGTAFRGCWHGGLPGTRQLLPPPLRVSLWTGRLAALECVS